MNKAELIANMAERTGKTKKQMAEALNAFIEVVSEELERGGHVRLVGFGTFETRTRKPKVGVNPKNPQQKINIPAKTVPIFKAGKELKKDVNTAGK